MWSAAGLALAVRTAVVTAWAGLLTLAGMRLLLAPGEVPAFLGGLARPLGLAAVGGGQFVFMTLVADRFFPGAARKAVVPLEMGAFGMFVAGPVWMVAGMVRLV